MRIWRRSQGAAHCEHTNAFLVAAGTIPAARDAVRTLPAAFVVMPLQVSPGVFVAREYLEKLKARRLEFSESPYRLANQ